MRIPSDAWFYRYAKEGYGTVTVMGARIGGSYVPIPEPVLLRKVGVPDSDMVLLPGRNLIGTIYGLDAAPIDLSNFLIDRLKPLFLAMSVNPIAGQ